MIRLKKKFAFDSDDVGFLTLALRSNGVVDGDDGCADPITNDCKILCSVSNEINVGDTVFQSTSILTPFNGLNKYYNMVISIWTEPDGSKVCQIDNDGIITDIYALCTI